MYIYVCDHVVCVGLRDLKKYEMAVLIVRLINLTYVVMMMIITMVSQIEEYYSSVDEQERAAQVSLDSVGRLEEVTRV